MEQIQRIDASASAQSMHEEPKPEIDNMGTSISSSMRRRQEDENKVEMED